MKNLIAISAAALTAASASAALSGYTNSVSYNSWTTQGSAGGGALPPGPGYTGLSFYTDTLHNATYSGITGTVTGGHGLGVYSLAPMTGNTVTSVFAAGTLDNTNIGGLTTGTNSPTEMTFTFSASSGAGNFLAGVGFAFSINPGQSIAVTMNFQGGGATTGFYTPTSSSNAFVGFWTSGSNAVTSVTFQAASAGSVFTVTDIYYGLVPAPGAVALVGLAGLVGSRRRRA